MIKVYLNSRFISDSYINDGITGKLTHVANIKVDNLDEAFSIAQNCSMTPWIYDDRVESIINKTNVGPRSVSAGDVFENESGKKYKIMDIGFKEII